MTSAANTTLQCFPIFDSRPSPAYIARWMKHIAETGRPEAFEGVSTTKPDRSARVVLLSDEININTDIRPDRDRAPCPLCSPLSPKFGKGRMAWFRDDGTVRFIGHRCARHYFGDDYIEADRLFKIETRCAEYLRIWPALRERRAAIREVAGQVYAVAHGLQSTKAHFDQTAPGIATFLHRDRLAHQGLVETGAHKAAKREQIQGFGFLSPDFEPRDIAGRIVRAANELATPLPAWAPADGETDAAKEIMRRGHHAVSKLSLLAELRDQVEDARKFFDTENLSTLERWASSGLSVFTKLMMRRRDNRMEIDIEYHGGQHDGFFYIHSGVDGRLPTNAQIDEIGISEILN